MAKSKLFPHMLGISGGVLMMSGMVLASIYGNHCSVNIMVVLGFLIFGSAGLVIISRKQYSLGFLEVKGLLSVIYGSIILFVGLAGAIFFGIFMFR